MISKEDLILFHRLFLSKTKISILIDKPLELIKAAFLLLHYETFTKCKLL